MFDTYTHKSESKVVAVTKEIEKTITPDRVTDMYDKVRKQVEGDVVAAYRVESNELKGVVIEIHEDFAGRQHKVLTHFVLNGKPYTDVETEVDMDLLTPTKLMERLYKHFQEAVARQVFKEFSPRILNLHPLPPEQDTKG